MQGSVVILTGGSSGIGLQTAKALAARGCTVYELSRHANSTPGILHLTADVTDISSVHTAVQTVLQTEGRIDILINNAGFGISGAIEFTAPADAKRLLDVNFFGMVNLCHEVLPIMREAGAGRIVNLSSVAAPVAIPFQAYYSVSKAAVNDYTLALANEVRPFGVSVCAVMPGDMRTGFTAAREKYQAGDDIYGGRISKSVHRMELDEQHGMDPQVAGQFLARVATKRRVKPLYTIGFQYQLVVFLIKLLPVRFANWMVGKLYG